MADRQHTSISNRLYQLRRHVCSHRKIANSCLTFSRSSGRLLSLYASDSGRVKENQHLPHLSHQALRKDQIKILSLSVRQNRGLSLLYARAALPRLKCQNLQSQRLCSPSEVYARAIAKHVKAVSRLLPWRDLYGRLEVSLLLQFLHQRNVRLAGVTSRMSRQRQRMGLKT